MPLPLTLSCFNKIQIGFTFLVPAHLGSPGKRAVKRVCVCFLSYYINAAMCSSYQYQTAVYFDDYSKFSMVLNWTFSCVKILVFQVQHVIERYLAIVSDWNWLNLFLISAHHITNMHTI